MIKPISKPSKTIGKFDSIDVRSYFGGAIFKETEFRALLKKENWQQFEGKRVLIKSCHAGPIPPWAFMLLVSHLIPYPKMIAYGEDCNPIVVYKNNASDNADDQTEEA